MKTVEPLHWRTEEPDSIELTGLQRAYNGEEMVLWWSPGFETFYLDLLWGNIFVGFLTDEWEHFRKILEKVADKAKSILENMMAINGKGEILLHQDRYYEITASVSPKFEWPNINVSLMMRQGSMIRLAPYEWRELLEIAAAVGIEDIMDPEEEKIKKGVQDDI